LFQLESKSFFESNWKRINFEGKIIKTFTIGKIQQDLAYQYSSM